MGAWSTYPPLEDLFNKNFAGVQPGRVWVIAPDQRSLIDRWQTLIHAPMNEKEELFHPCLRNGKPAGKYSTKVVTQALPGQPKRLLSVAEEKKDVLPPVRYSFRSFDRQWIIPDNRVLNFPRPQLWDIYSPSQLYLTAFLAESPTSGCALTIAGNIPDLHHYKGSFGGRAFPLWADAEATIPNINPALLDFLSQTYSTPVSPEAAFAYIAAIAANPAYTERFRDDLATPGLRIPLTADRALFDEAVTLGQRVLWLHTFGERMADPEADRPAGAPRLPRDRRPTIPKNGTIPSEPDRMPDTIGHDPATHRLLIGDGYIENVPAAVWHYEVSGKQTILHWFSYRKKNRDRPIIGNRRPPSKLNQIYPDHWLDEYTTELINLLNVLGLLVDLEPQQADLLERICNNNVLSVQTLKNTDALNKTTVKASVTSNPDQLTIPYDP
jgi:hypothetical protein